MPPPALACPPRARPHASTTLIGPAHMPVCALFSAQQRCLAQVPTRPPARRRCLQEPLAFPLPSCTAVRSWRFRWHARALLITWQPAGGGRCNGGALRLSRRCMKGAAPMRAAERKLSRGEEGVRRGWCEMCSFIGRKIWVSGSLSIVDKRVGVIAWPAGAAAAAAATRAAAVGRASQRARRGLPGPAGWQPSEGLTQGLVEGCGASSEIEVELVVLRSRALRRRALRGARPAMLLGGPAAQGEAGGQAG